MDARLPRKLAAILYADVAGYSRLSGDDEDATHRALSEYLDLISGIITSHRGKVMHYAGDAVLASFDAVVDAISSAIDPAGNDSIAAVVRPDIMACTFLSCSACFCSNAAKYDLSFALDLSTGASYTSRIS